MPNYRNIKKRVEYEEESYRKKLESLEKKYKDIEDKLIDDLANEVKKEIEEAVYHFYKKENDRRIQKKGLFSLNYTFSTQRHPVVVAKKEAIENMDAKFYLSTPEQIHIKGFCFPSLQCLDSFMRKANEILNREKMSIFKYKDRYTEWEYTLSIHAEIGRL